MKCATVLLIVFLVTASGGLCLIPVKNGIVPPRSILIHFRNTIGGEPLQLDKSYTTILDEKIIVRKLKYYISNFSVTDEKGKITKLPASYFLVDEADPLSKNIRLRLPAERISHIRFILGVDSIRNVSGVQTGVLDPVKGMFWTWNSGYIMAKLEGSSEASTSPGHYFTYHIGGYRPGQKTARAIDLAVSAKDFFTSEIVINAEINQWFKGSTVIRIAETPVCHSPGQLAVRIADNYSNMFTLKSFR